MCITRANLTCSVMATKMDCIASSSFSISSGLQRISGDTRAAQDCLSRQFPSPQATAHDQDSKLWNLDMNLPFFILMHRSLPTRLLIVSHFYSKIHDIWTGCWFWVSKILLFKIKRKITLEITCKYISSLSFSYRKMKCIFFPCLVAVRSYTE